MFKLNVHSIVDVITNSSTVIYTYQDSTKEAKELLQEILNLIGEKKDVDDLFHIGVFLSEDDYYIDSLDNAEEYPENFPVDDWKAQSKYIADLQEKILKGEASKPDWMENIEDGLDYDDYRYSTSLYILPKDEKYTGLVKKMLTFLNFPSHEATRG